MSLVIVPSIDLRNGKVIRLKQGDYSRQINYDVDPLETAVLFRKAGAQWMHVVDLDGAKEGRPVQTDLIRMLTGVAGLQLEVGGGIRSTADIQTLLEAGVARVVIGTKALEDWAWFEKLAHDPQYKGKLVLAIDAKDGFVATRAWTETTKRLATDIARQVTGWPLAALLYTDVAKDGMMTGPNFEHTQKLAEAGDVPVIASGGVGSIEHIKKLKSLSVWGVIVGRSLYEGAVDLREAIEVAKS